MSPRTMEPYDDAELAALKEDTPDPIGIGNDLLGNGWQNKRTHRLIATVEKYRAALAAAERERDEARSTAHAEGLARGTAVILRGVAEERAESAELALAAAQADALALRELGPLLERAGHLLETEGLRLASAECLDAASKLSLSRSPSSTDALRSLLMQMAGLTWALAAPDREMDSRACIAAVDAILGPAPTEGTKR